MSFRVTEWTFHWRFWDPKECIGGKVHFGWWARLDNGSEQTAMQVIIKRDMGLIEYER